MKAFVKDMNSYEARVANRSMSESLERVNGIPCEGDVMIGQAFLAYGTEKEHHRPFLVLSGEVQSIRGEFPQGVTEVCFPETARPSVDYQYSFTNEELSDLCKKGLFDDGFSIPSIFLNNKFELPMDCNVCAVPTEDVPILFVSVDRPFNQEISKLSCGYQLADYFEQAKNPTHEFDEMEELPQAHMDDMFGEPDAEQEEEAEAPKELTERDKTLMKVVEEADIYTKTRVAERTKFLEQQVVSEDTSEDDTGAQDDVLPEDVNSDDVTMVHKEESSGNRAAVRRHAVQENQRLNAEDDVKQERKVPSHMQAIADKAAQPSSADDYVI